MNAGLPQPQSPDPAPAPPASPLTLRQAGAAISVGLFLIVLVAVLIRYTELVSGQYVSNGVPPLPAFGALVLLSAARPLLQRYATRLVPSRAQIFLIYCMMTIGVVLNSLYNVRGFLPELVALQYWGRSGSPYAMHLAGYAAYLPSWFAPHDLKAIKDYYEGTAPGGRIPWSVWLLPLACWSLFFVAMFLGVFSFITLVQRQWTREERLAFPLLTIPLALTSGERFGLGSVRSRRGLFLLGVGVAAAFDGLNMLHSFYPSLPSTGFQINFYSYFPNRPWTALQSVRIYFMLETIGLGYFVPLDISFSIWFFYFLSRAFAVAGTAAGNDQPGFPFIMEQAAGGYLAMALLLLWALRRTFTQSLRRALRPSPHDAAARAERWAWIGLTGSTLFILGFCRTAGFSLWLALPYFGIIALFTLVFARIRAETGVPLQIIYPALQKDLVLNAFSVRQSLAWGGTGAFVLFSSFTWLTNYQPSMDQAAYQLDSVKLSQEGNIPYKTLFIALLLAFILGLFAAYWTHLSAYYAQGSNLVASAGDIGEYREEQARQGYELMASQLVAPPYRDTTRLLAVFGGFCFVMMLSWLRRFWLGCPFHPLGFLVATAGGDTATSWFPMLLAWIAKGTLLKIGGLPLYRRGMPFFLGLAIGHFLIAGLLWPCIGVFISKEAANSYHLLFGE